MSFLAVETLSMAIFILAHKYDTQTPSIGKKLNLAFSARRRKLHTHFPKLCAKFEINTNIKNTEADK
jgi:hypothetical protein